MILTLETVTIKFESGQKVIPFDDLLKIELETEKKYRLKGTLGKEIYFHCITIDPDSKCIGNYQYLNTFIKASNNSFSRSLPKALHKDPYQHENNILQIRSFSNLQGMNDIEVEVSRMNDINSKCDINSPEKITLLYYIL